MKKDNYTERMDTISLWEKIAYGGGDTACNVVMGILGSLLALFYTDYAGISAAIVGAVMLISRVFDGVSDIIMGVLVEKTHTKWGKARPWILWMAVPYALATVALFCVPAHTTSGVQFLYIFVTYNLVTTVIYTALNLPYGVLSSMMTRSQHEREIISIIRMAMAPLGRMIAVTFTMPVVKLFGNDQAAWIKAMSMWSAVALILLLICFFTCKERVHIPAAQKKVPLKKGIRALLSNKYWLYCMLLWSLTSVHYSLVGMDLPYYCKYILGNDDWMYSTLFTVEFLVLSAGALICPILLRKMSKRNLALGGAILAVAAQLVFLINPVSYGWAMATCIVRAVGEAPLIAVVFAMLGDSVEYGQWKTHIRQESFVFSGASIGTKLGAGLANAGVGGILSFAGYISATNGSYTAQPDSAISMILNIYKYGPILIWGLAIVILLFYKLDKIYPSIMQDLIEREKRGEL